MVGYWEENRSQVLWRHPGLQNQLAGFESLAVCQQKNNMEISIENDEIILVHNDQEILREKYSDPGIIPGRSISDILGGVQLKAEVLSASLPKDLTDAELEEAKRLIFGVLSRTP